jgi:hypothetical protein
MAWYAGILNGSGVRSSEPIRADFVIPAPSGERQPHGRCGRSDVDGELAGSAMSGITIAKSYHPKAAVVVMSSKASE